jgi:hypothetical protein
VGRVLTKQKFRKPCWDVTDILDRLRAGETCESLFFLPAVLGGVEGVRGLGMPGYKYFATVTKVVFLC